MNSLTMNRLAAPDPSSSRSPLRKLAPMSRPRPFRPAFAALLAAALLAPALPVAARAEDGAKQADKQAGPAITVTTVKRDEIVQSVVVAGTMVARDEVLVTPEVDGLVITELLAEEGDRVAAGQVLARLSRTTLEVQRAQNEAQSRKAQAGIDQARAQIVEAQANREQADNAFERTKALRGSGNASQEMFDQRAAASRSAQARLNAANQALAMAEADLALSQAQGRDIEVRLGRTQIKAPRDGIVSRRTARQGAIAGMAAEPLFRIIADGAIELEAEIAEVELPRLRTGQAVAVTPAGADTALAGEVRLIAPEVDRASRLGKLRVALAGNPPVALGSFARGVVETGRRNGLVLPLSAITYTRAGPTVQAVAGGKISTRKVALGLIGRGHVEIVSGVAEGDTVVARAGTFVRDGDVITPVASN